MNEYNTRHEAAMTPRLHGWPGDRLGCAISRECYDGDSHEAPRICSILQRARASRSATARPRVEYR
jgi:hypothetical protein